MRTSTRCYQPSFLARLSTFIFPFIFFLASLPAYAQQTCSGEFDITIDRAYNPGSNTTVYEFTVKRTGARYALSHWGFPIETCPGQSVSSLLAGVVAETSTSGTTWTPVIIEYGIDGSTEGVCTNTEILKFEQEMEDETVRHFRLTFPGNVNFLIPFAYVKYGNGCCILQLNYGCCQEATVNAGPDQAVCPAGPVQLAGVIGGSATSATWSGGTGTFNPNASTLNAIYTPSAAEVAAGSVTLTLTTNDPPGSCLPASDQVTITIGQAATVNAGSDQTICAGQTVQLAGAIGGSATSATWSGGTGTFNPNASALNAVYTPSAAEVAAGSVTLTLTTNDPPGACQAVSDQVTITIDPPTSVNAGPDQTICPSGPVQLAGVIGGSATSATWSGGTGTFNPNASTLNAIYTPSAAEASAGSVTLTLTTNDPAGPCGSANDQVTITILQAATVNAGSDQTICAGQTVQLAGVIGGSATSATWSGGTGTFNPNASALNAVYTPSAAEVAAGSVTLTLTTNDPPGACQAVSDHVTITINPPTSVNAGPDQTICPSGPVQLVGVIGGSATSATWSGGTGTFNPNASALNAIYTPSAAEVTAGWVTLTLTTNDPAGPCGPAHDQMTITIGQPASVNAGSDQTICAGHTVQLAGIIGGSATSATWSGGTGTFNPNASALNAVYTPSAAEVAAGSVTLTLTTNDPPGACQAVWDQVTITINPPTSVNAGPDQTICPSGPVQLAGVIGGSATSATWSGGTGTFNPNASALNAIYTPSAAEVTAGWVTLTLTTNDPAGPCGPAHDQMTITIGQPATVNAGSDQTICAGQTVQLAGTIGGSATSATWSGGTGTFNPNASALNAVYTPSAAEVAAGSVTLTLSTNDPPGACQAVWDQVKITIDKCDVGLQGCTPGYWKNHPQAWGCGYTPTTKFFDVFMVVTNRRGLPADLTLMEAVSLGGGEYKALVRHAVAALLNACHSNVDYPYTGTQIISAVVSMFNSGSATLGGKNYSGVEALKDELDRANNLGCPLNNSNYMTLLGGVRENNEPGSEMVSVTTSPNPFSDVVRFSILSNYTGKAELKLLNMTGQPIATVFRGTVEANKQQVIEYRANKLLPQNLIYTLKLGDKQITGKLFRAPKN